MIHPVRRIRHLSRRELYDLVWQSPMSRLGEEFGISDKGLAKICARMDIPCPQRGYWAQKAAGRAVQPTPLPPEKKATRKVATIRATVVPPLTPPEQVVANQAAESAATGIQVPDSMDGLHPKVRDWFAIHHQEQLERIAEQREARKDTFDWSRPLRGDLTERDLYRFRVTSAVFYAVEAAGGSVVKASVIGKVTFRIDGEDIDCSIVEKLYRPLRAPGGSWTAWPDHHQTGLYSTGFLRVTITTYVQGTRTEWVETQTRKIGDDLPQIAGGIVAAAAYRKRREQEFREAELSRQEEEERQAQLRWEREREAKRWQAFRGAASDWQEHARLSAYLVQLRQRLEAEGDQEVQGRRLSEWVAWAQRHTDELDPLSGGLAGLFGTRMP